MQNTIRLGGRFDFNAHRKFREATEQHLQDLKCREIVIDLTQVDYADSSALGMLLLLRDKATTTKQAVSIRTIGSSSVHKVLSIANFDKIFNIIVV